MAGVGVELEPQSLVGERARGLQILKAREGVAVPHVHAVIGGEGKPERMLCDFKAYATRALRSKAGTRRRRYWADHGSTRYLWNEASVKAAIDYVLNGQGVKMACYPADAETEPRA